MLRTSTQTTKRILGIALVLAAILPPSLASAQKKKPKKPTPAPTATATETAAPSATETATAAATATVNAAPVVETAPAVTTTASATVEPPPTAVPPAASASVVESHVKPPPPHQAAERHVTVPIVVSGIVSGVALISGVVFSISAASKHSSYVSQPDQEVGLAGERSMFVADISFGVSALFGLTALALYIFPDEQEPPPPPPPPGTPTAGATPDSSTYPAHAASAKRLPWYAAAVLGAPVSF